MMIDGVWRDNITCKRCRYRHPADLKCEEAKRLAEEKAFDQPHHGHDAVTDAARNVVEAYYARFAVGDGSTLFGPIDAEIKELQEALGV